MTANGRRALPIRLLAGLMEEYKRSADQQMRIPDQGTAGDPIGRRSRHRRRDRLDQPGDVTEAGPVRDEYARTTREFAQPGPRLRPDPCGPKEASHARPESALGPAPMTVVKRIILVVIVGAFVLVATTLGYGDPYRALRRLGLVR